METSNLLARLIGPLLVVVGAGVLLNPTHYMKMTENFLKDAQLHYFSGATAFLIGMAMVLHHNIWVSDWRVTITVIGWMSLIKGAVRILFPAAGSRLAAALVASPAVLRISAAIVLLLGLWLAYRGLGS